MNQQSQQLCRAQALITVFIYVRSWYWFHISLCCTVVVSVAILFERRSNLCVYFAKWEQFDHKIRTNRRQMCALVHGAINKQTWKPIDWLIDLQTLTKCLCLSMRMQMCKVNLYSENSINNGYSFIFTYSVNAYWWVRWNGLFFYIFGQNKRQCVRC